MRARSDPSCALHRQRGAALLLTFVLMLALSSIGLAVGTLGHHSVLTGRTQLENFQVAAIAEAGLARARREFTTGGQAPGWSASDVAFHVGTYTVTTTDNGNGTSTIMSSAYIPNVTSPVAKRRIREKNVPVTAGGTNIAIGSTATASSYTGQNTPAKAVDNDAGTRWRCATGNGCWLALDFGTNKVLTKTDYDEQGNKIVDYSIEISRDGTNWETVRGLSKSGDVATFDKVTARYVRILITSVTEIEPALDEFKVYAVTTGSLRTLGNGTVVIEW